MTTVASLSVTDLARDCLKAASGDREKAKMMFLRRLEREREVADLLKERLFEIAAGVAIASVTLHTSDMMARVHGERTVTATKTRLTPDQEREALATCRSWMLTPLYGGTVLLRDATREQLRESAERHLRQAAGHSKSAALHSALAKRLKSGQTVKDVLSEEQVNEIARTL